MLFNARDFYNCFYYPLDIKSGWVCEFGWNIYKAGSNKDEEFNILFAMMLKKFFFSKRQSRNYSANLLTMKESSTSRLADQSIAVK